MFSRGKGTLQVSTELFAENRRRLVAELKGKAPPRSVILLQGGVEKTRYHTDAEDLPFRQESFFFWTFGVFESDCYGAIDVDTGRSWLFPPRLDSSYAIWDGNINDEAWFQKRYAVDAVNFHEGNGKNMAEYIQCEWKPSQLLLLQDYNSDSNKVLEPAEFDGKETFPSIDLQLLSPSMVQLRVHKTDRELEVMRYASKIACEAHMTVMKHIRPGHYEYQMESLFRHYSYYHGGCRHLAYTCIAASGKNCAILHYGHVNAPNDKMIGPGDMCLFDMGPEYFCYASDVTSSFPVSGKFTEKQKTIYRAVLEANRAVFKAAKVGVRLKDMHKLAMKIILTHLKKAGLVVGDVDEMMAAEIEDVFMPHKLGHFIGLDVHDCRGYVGKAQERMVITIEPGCYFIDTILEKAYKHPVKSQYLVKETIDEYKDIGGVRIEDVVIIWEKGNENISHMLPRTVEEIEAFMADRVEGDMIPSRPSCNKGICGSMKKCSTSLTFAMILLVAFSYSLYLYASKQ